jgi:hypothetical protein
MVRSGEPAPMAVAAGSAVSLMPGGDLSGGRFLDTDCTGMSVRFSMPTTTASTSIFGDGSAVFAHFSQPICRGPRAGVQRGNYRRASRRGGRIVGRKRTDNPAEFGGQPGGRRDSKGPLGGIVAEADAAIIEKAAKGGAALSI